VIGLIPIMVLEKTNLVWLKSNTRIGRDPFVLAHQIEQVYYMLYPCEKLSAWWVVYGVNPREQLHTPDDSSHENQVAAGEVDEVYQDDELPCSFNIDLDSALKC
jgi:hypothetical protein